MVYEWSSDLETGYKAIDDQHRALFAAVNDFSNAYHSGKGSEEIEKTLTFLIEYTAQHFHDEEELQQKYAFPHFARHRQDHNLFKKQVLRLASRFKTEGLSDALMTEIYESVGSWLLHHIKSDDFVLAAFLRHPE